jgi:ubiquinone biosynthesis protein
VLEDFMTMARENDLAMPTDLAILFKALITWDGVMRQLDPNFDLFAAAAPTVQRRMKARFSIGGMRRKIETLGSSMYGAATEMPEPHSPAPGAAQSRARSPSRSRSRASTS